jgi:hypothetical protein
VRDPSRRDASLGESHEAVSQGSARMIEAEAALKQWLDNTVASATAAFDAPLRVQPASFHPNRDSLTTLMGAIGTLAQIARAMRCPFLPKLRVL